MNFPPIGSRYRHYKSTGGSDHTYEVVGIAKHSETEELLVVYKPLYDTKETRLWPCDYAARPLVMRDEMVERKGDMVKRFTEIE